VRGDSGERRAQRALFAPGLVFVMWGNSVYQLPKEGRPLHGAALAFTVRDNQSRTVG
jgi:hypothetical protein